MGWGGLVRRAGFLGYGMYAQHTGQITIIRSEIRRGSVCTYHFHKEEVGVVVDEILGKRQLYGADRVENGGFGGRGIVLKSDGINGKIFGG